MSKIKEVPDFDLFAWLPTCYIPFILAPGALEDGVILDIMDHDDM